MLVFQTRDGGCVGPGSPRGSSHHPHPASHTDGRLPRAVAATLSAAAPELAADPSNTLAALAAAHTPMSRRNDAPASVPPPAESQRSDQPGDEVPPWRQLFHGEAQQQEQQQEQEQEQQHKQEQQQQHEAPGGEQQQQLTELQQQLLLAYRKTFLVAGLGLAGAVWRWNTVTKHRMQDIFLPPRAQALPPQVVEQWKQKARLREALRTVGRQTLFITSFAGLYFGVELGTGLARGVQGDWGNTAVAGAAAGALLGARVPSSMRGRTLVLGTAVGGVMGAASGWLQQQLLQRSDDGDGSAHGPA